MRMMRSVALLLFVFSEAFTQVRSDPNMHVVVAPNALKECLTAEGVGEAIARGCRAIADEITIDVVPLADGGDGTAVILSKHYDAGWKDVRAHDPLGRMINSGFSWSKEYSFAVVEIAKASGLALLKNSEKNPMITSSRGVGDLLKAAIELGMENITVSLGGSATNDAGAGMAYALGFRFHDANGKEVVPTGGTLHQIKSCRFLSDPKDLEIYNKLRSISLTVAVDVEAPLIGKGGATDKFSPQKGAKPQDMAVLEEGLQSMLRLWNEDRNFNSDFDYNGPGTGAAGGLGAGLVAFCGATMKSGFQLVSEAVDLESRILKADLVLTAEGMVDASKGKVPMELATLCQRLGKPCAAITGAMPSVSDIKTLNASGMSAGIFSLAPGPITLQESMAKAGSLLEQTSEQIVRAFTARRVA